MVTLVTSEAKPWYSEPCIVGVDEAGRGPVLGPMVYGVAACPAAYQEPLKSRQYNDSKAMSADKREQLYERLKGDAQMAWATSSLSAQYISAHMLAPGRTSLNEMAAQSTFSLLRAFLDAGMNIMAVFVDTVGDAGKYKSRLGAEFPGIEFTVCPKADALYPIVSAASILAKVSRDLELEALAGGAATGSGYPGDPLTKAWLGNNMDPVFGFAPMVRFSWQTAVKLLDVHAAKITFEADVEDTDQAALSFMAPSKAGPAHSTGAGRHGFFRARRIQRDVHAMW